MRTLLGTIAGTIVVLVGLIIVGFLVWFTANSEYGILVPASIVIIFMGWSLGGNWFKGEH